MDPFVCRSLTEKINDTIALIAMVVNPEYF